MPAQSPEEFRETNRRFTEWERRLRCGSPDVRLEAAREPPPEPRPLVIEALGRSLAADEDPELSRSVLEALERFGESATPALVIGLRSRERPIRRAAAAALERVGDGRALAELQRAFDRCYDRGSPRSQLAWGLLLLAAGCFQFAFALEDMKLMQGVTGTCLLVWATLRVLAHRSIGKDLRPFASAMAAVTERTMDGRRLPPVSSLLTASRDSVHHDRATRRACADAARRVNRAAERLRSLPVASEAPSPALEELPLPATGRLQAGSDLPRVSLDGRRGG